MFNWQGDEFILSKLAVQLTDSHVEHRPTPHHEQIPCVIVVRISPEISLYTLFGSPEQVNGKVLSPVWIAF